MSSILLLFFSLWYFQVNRWNSIHTGRPEYCWDGFWPLKLMTFFQLSESVIVYEMAISNLFCTTRTTKPDKVLTTLPGHHSQEVKLVCFRTTAKKTFYTWVFSESSDWRKTKRVWIHFNRFSPVSLIIHSNCFYCCLLKLKTYKTKLNFWLLSFSFHITHYTDTP